MAGRAACTFVTVLCCAYVPSAVSACLALDAVVLVTVGELVQSLIVGPIVAEPVVTRRALASRPGSDTSSPS